MGTPGREVIQLRVDFDLGYGAPKHTHPGEEIIYVIEGVLEDAMGGTASKLKAGDVLFVPAGTIHTATNVGRGNGAELATYIVEKGKRLSRSSDRRFVRDWATITKSCRARPRFQEMQDEIQCRIGADS